MKDLIIVIASIILGVALFTMLLGGNNSIYSASKEGMKKNIEYLNQIP